jgi:hypothetical protein
MKRGNRNAHRNHNPPADGPDQRRKDHQTRFMRANEGPQPARRLEIAGRSDHLLRPNAAKTCRQPRLTVFARLVQSRRKPARRRIKAANALHNPVTLPVVCQRVLLRS